jgi:hypothetical protein
MTSAESYSYWLDALHPVAVRQAANINTSFFLNIYFRDAIGSIYSIQRNIIKLFLQPV